MVSPARPGRQTPTALPALSPVPLAFLELASDWTELSPATRLTLAALAWALPFLLLSSLFAMLRVALLRSHAGRVLSQPGAEKERGRTAPLLQRADRLAISAEILEVASEVVFLVLLYCALSGGSELDPLALLWTLL